MYPDARVQNLKAVAPKRNCATPPSREGNCSSLRELIVHASRRQRDAQKYLDMTKSEHLQLLRPIDINRQARVPYRTVIAWLEIGHPRAGVLPSVNLAATGNAGATVFVLTTGMRSWRGWRLISGCGNQPPHFRARRPWSCETAYSATEPSWRWRCGSLRAGGRPVSAGTGPWCRCGCGPSIRPAPGPGGRPHRPVWRPYGASV